MIRIIHAVAAASLLCIAPASAQSLAALDNAKPALRASAVVTGDVVRIGDLVDNAGIVANIPIFRAPDLGTTGFVPATQVIAAVGAHALVGLDAGGIDDVRVTRASREIMSADIETTISSALAERFAIGDAKDISLRFDRPLRTVHAEPTSTGELSVTRINYEPRSGRFDAIVDIPGKTTSHLRFGGTAIASTNVVLLTRPLGRGDVVRASDITVERRARADVGPDVVTDAAQAIGKAARNSLSNGRPLRNADLTKPELVQRNDAVMLVYEVPGIMLTVRGKALESGSEGDVVEALNIQSNRNVHGVVMGPGKVVVSELAANLAAAELRKPNSSNRSR